MKKLFRFVESGPISGDCTAPYSLKFNRKNVTVEDFVESVLSREEWGKIKVIVESNGQREEQTLEYSCDKIFGEFEHSNMTIKYASAHGGWSRMDYCLTVG